MSSPKSADNKSSKLLNGSAVDAAIRDSRSSTSTSDAQERKPELHLLSDGDGDGENTQLLPWSEPAWYAALVSPYYTATHRALRDHVRRYMDTHVLPHAATWEAAGSCPLSARRAWLATGLPLLDVPPAYRPQQQTAALALTPNKTANDNNKDNKAAEVVLLPLDKLDAFHFLILNDECARLPGGVASGLAGANVIGLPPVLHHGTTSQKRRWLPGLFTGATNFCLGVTEPSGGSDVGGLRTTAVRSSAAEDGDGSPHYYVVTGTKKWITGAPWATHMTTAVRTGGAGSGVGGISLLVIPLVEEEDGDTDIDTNPRERKRAKGITIEKIHNSGQNAGGASWVHLDHVRVLAENLLGPENGGFKLLMSNFNKERFVLAVSCNRQARTCLSTALAYALERETFGQPLVHHQVIRHKLTTLARDVEAHWAWLEQIAYHVDHCPDGKGWQSESIAGRIALAKVSGGRILELAAREAQQVMGGVAYQRDGPGGGGRVEQIARDLRMNVVGGGSEEILNDLAFREEMKRARKLGAHL
ncbi:acyl-CoA dehydrogenase [Apiospora arundinis]|uniref:Acyl-CoA dehydrogenase n=1 Tax=Apiospora arundinis TaxID=335852 RepID=A0ABR2JGP6_9PEZI